MPLSLQLSVHCSYSIKAERAMPLSLQVSVHCSYSLKAERAMPLSLQVSVHCSYSLKAERAMPLSLQVSVHCSYSLKAERAMPLSLQVSVHPAPPALPGAGQQGPGRRRHRRVLGAGRAVRLCPHVHQPLPRPHRLPTHPRLRRGLHDRRAPRPVLRHQPDQHGALRPDHEDGPQAQEAHRRAGRPRHSFFLSFFTEGI